jgi:hypothetical protein
MLTHDVVLNLIQVRYGQDQANPGMVLALAPDWAKMQVQAAADLGAI